MFAGLNERDPPGATVTYWILNETSDPHISWKELTSTVDELAPTTPEDGDALALADELVELELVVSSAFGKLYWGLASAMRGNKAAARRVDPSMMEESFRFDSSVDVYLVLLILWLFRRRHNRHA